MKLFYFLCLSLLIAQYLPAVKILPYRFHEHFATRHYQETLDNPEQLEKLIKRNIDHVHRIQQLTLADYDRGNALTEEEIRRSIQNATERTVLGTIIDDSKRHARETDVKADDAYALSHFFSYYIIVRMLPDQEQFTKFIGRVTPLLEQRLPAGALERLFPQ